jgi:hypothetical protein
MLFIVEVAVMATQSGSTMVSSNGAKQAVLYRMVMDIDKRELKCACVSGDSNVPLGFISLTENLMMVAMAFWMLVMRFW